MKLKFSVGKDSYDFDIPESINDLTLEQFINLQKTIEKTKDEKEVDKVLEIVSTLSKIPLKALKTIDAESVGVLLKYVNDFLHTDTTIEFKEKSRGEGKNYGMNPTFDALTLGEFVDLETYSKNWTNNLHRILAILYRPIKNKQVVDYTPDRERGDMFLKKLYIKDVYGTFVKYLDYRTKLYEDFEELFTTGEKEHGINSYNDMGEKWGWYNHIYLLANENILNINKITKLPVYECLTFMTYKQDLNEKLENERRFNKV